MHYFRTHTEINLQAIQHNAEAIKGHTRKKLIAVIKADAYGHGAVRVTEVLDATADMFAVATVEEGITLRQADIHKPILVLFSSLPVQAAPIVEYGLTPTIGDWEFAKALHEVGSVKVHVNVNTGMNRSGVCYTEAMAFLSKLKTLHRLEVEGLFTHFATADEADKSFVSAQLKRFLSVLVHVSGKMIHAANSAAALSVPESYFDAVRPGLSLYGIYPAAEKPIPLKPALTWKTRVGWIEAISEGEGVSYGLTYKAPQQTRVAMVQVGYGDGYPRVLSNSGEVLVGGKRRPIIGRVCMDVSVVQLQPEDNVSVGDEVVLIGSQGDAEITVDEVAHRAGTISYEILTQIGTRVNRTFLPSNYKNK
ncbi:MAG: alanine racemase [Candidatus Poribacteria bacterium]|nr:alanine racemase [Candidatus Poribacteria bacterium]